MLAFANGRTNATRAPYSGYALVYPVAMVGKIVVAQILGGVDSTRGEHTDSARPAVSGETSDTTLSTTEGPVPPDRPRSLIPAFFTAQHPALPWAAWARNDCPRSAPRPSPPLTDRSSEARTGTSTRRARTRRRIRRRRSGSGDGRYGDGDIAPGLRRSPGRSCRTSTRARSGLADISRVNLMRLPPSRSPTGWGSLSWLSASQFLSVSMR